jgi:hypothetical protein
MARRKLEWKRGRGEILISENIKNIWEKARKGEDYVNLTEKYVGLSIIVQIYINPAEEECDDRGSR